MLVAQLGARTVEPPSGVSLLVRAQQMERFELLADIWVPWQAWFAELEETHTSLGVLSFFRSPRAHRSWVTSSGAVLDAASLRLAAVDLGFEPQAGLCVRSGFVALRAVAEYFDIDFDPDPAPTDPISITRDEFDERVPRARRRRHPGARRSRPGVARLRGLARELRRAAARARRTGDGAVRAVVVGPIDACAPARDAAQRIQVSRSLGSWPTRMNHSVPKKSAKTSSGMARKNDSALI